ncbi:hypothetical protein B0H14DRAFT_3860682 [Mycena olivaceomarginata]|nr:hypothetical protein B0H14DRAFT_3860682 [Mycena olivaceomarginata]
MLLLLIFLSLSTMAELPAKVTIMKGVFPDLSAATYQIHDESHTIGNTLRWMLMKIPKVELCGYRQVCSPLVPCCIWCSFVGTSIYLQASFSPSGCLYGVAELSRLARAPFGAPLSSRAFTSKRRFTLRMPIWRSVSAATLRCHHELERRRCAKFSSLSALITALADLDALCATIQDRYVTDIREGDYERWTEEYRFYWSGVSRPLYFRTVNCLK